MIRFLLDEDFKRKFERWLRVRRPDLDMVHVQDTEMYRTDDPEILDWAVPEKRIVLTHDLDTMTKYAKERIKQGLPFAGVILIGDILAIANIIEDLLIMVDASESSEWEHRVQFPPL
jgi:predicted nuclease of predicted toxin-antitoxin system